MKFKCKDTGMKCNFEVKEATSRDELTEIAQVHARRVHNLTTLSPDMQNKLSKAIKN